jgi:hypothetical protein
MASRYFSSRRGGRARSSERDWSVSGTRFVTEYQICRTAFRRYFGMRPVDVKILKAGSTSNGPPAASEGNS